MSLEALVVGLEYQAFKSGNVHELIHIVLANGDGVIEHHGNQADMPRLRPRVYPAGKWVPSQCIRSRGMLINPINEVSDIKASINHL